MFGLSRRREERKMRITSAEFARTAVTSNQFPRDGLPEIVLIGRSNVGKSSLINTLLNRKSLAKTSSAPGKTRTVNFYLVNKGFYLVDLPGFGYAKVPAHVRRSWEKMVDGYFSGRRTVAGAIILLDVRREPGELEEYLYGWVDGLGIPALTVLTKTDKLSGNRLARRAAEIRRALPGVDPILFSAVSKRGRAELLKALHGVLEGAIDVG